MPYFSSYLNIKYSLFTSYIKDKKSKDNLIFINYLNNTKPSNNCSDQRSLLNLLGITTSKFIEYC